MKKGILSERLSKNRFDLLLFQEVVNETIFAGVILFHVHVSFLKRKSIVFTLWTAVIKTGNGEQERAQGREKNWNNLRVSRFGVFVILIQFSLQ